MAVLRQVAVYVKRSSKFALGGNDRSGTVASESYEFTIVWSGICPGFNSEFVETSARGS